MTRILAPEEVDYKIMGDWLKNYAIYRCHNCGKRGTYPEMYNHTTICYTKKDLV